VKALGQAWGLPVVQLELGKLRDPGVGVTEANTYRVTRFAEAMAPCIIWADEAEKSFAGSHSSSRSDAGTTSRSLAILSTWLQETSAEICLAMTTNSLGTLPVEFTNRMSERFFFDVPSEDDRVDILKIHLATVGRLSKAQIAEVNLRRLAEVSENMVPREMEQAVEAALRKSFVLGRPSLDCEVLEQELRTKPRILKTMDTEVREVINWVGYDETSRDGLRARFASTRQSSNTARLLLEGGLE
jgi:SpoVK/Ycf46/Vps4 family AAA+-type ATPase